jgi:hypothetical protein
MLKFISLLIFLLPPWYSRPEFNFSGDTVWIYFKTQNPSSVFKLVYGPIHSPWDLTFHKYTVSRITDTLHAFPLLNLKPETLYVLKGAFFDSVTKVYYATQNYFFRYVIKDGKPKEGIVIDVGPYLSMLDENDFSVSFYTNVPVKAELYLNSKLIKRSDSESFRHEFILTDLKPGIYSYFVKVFNEEDTLTSFEYHFEVARYPQTKIGVFGDTRGNPNSVNPEFFVDGVNEEILRSTMRELYNQGVNVVFILGDLITGRMKEWDYAEAEYKSFLKACWPYCAFIPVMPVPGNHDMIAPVAEDEEKRFDPTPPYSAEDLWAKVFSLPANGPENEPGKPSYKENVYMIRFGKLTIYALNSDYNYVLYKNRPNPTTRVPDSLQRQWLAQKVKENKDSKINILFFHEPLIGLGIELRGERESYTDSIADFYKNLGFNFYIASHDHMYARGRLFNGLIQIVTGGGGAPLYDLKKTINEKKDINLECFRKAFHYIILSPIRGHKIKLTVKTLNGEKIEELLLP